MKLQCAVCGSDQPQQRSPTGGPPYKNPTWYRHTNSAIVCGPVCAGFYETKYGLMRFGWTAYNPEEPAS